MLEGPRARRHYKAEAIVSPADLVRYFGTGKHFGKVSNLAYHTSLMVQFWASLASRDTRLMVADLRSFPPTPPGTAWATYIRFHNDIGWAVTDDAAAAVGLDGAAHSSFCRTTTPDSSGARTRSVRCFSTTPTPTTGAILEPWRVSRASSRL